ncbi:ATP-binding protein [Terasakiispira papahanaumokuakeensis]|nr:ATP-binding protein [Terasakiispira papahanaumokuakeensis]
MSVMLEARASRSSRVLMVVIFMIITLGLVTQTARWTWQHELGLLREQAVNELRLYQTSMQGRLAKYEYLAELLTTRENLGRYLSGLNRVDEASASHLQALNLALDSYRVITGVSDIYLMDRQGTTRAASNWWRGTSFIGKNFSFRPYFKQAMAGQSGRFYGLGTTSGARGYYFSYPVMQGDDVLGVLVVKIDINQIEQPWSDPNGELLVTDPDGVVFISSRPEWRLKTLKPLSEERRQQLRDSLRYAGQSLDPLPIEAQQRLPDRDHEVMVWKERFPSASYLHLTEPMPEAGWELHILKQLTPVRQQVYFSMLLTALGMLALGLIGLFLRQRRRVHDQRHAFERAAQKALELNEARIRHIIDSTRAGLVTLSAEGTIRAFNPMAEAMFERDRLALDGEPFKQLIDPVDMQAVEHALMKMEGQPLEVSGLTANRRRFPLELTVSPLGDGERLLTLYDVSERKAQEGALRQAHDELEARVEARTADLSASNMRLLQEIEEHRCTEVRLRQTQDELVQAGKLAVLGQLSASINHELNQPITAIRAYAENGRAFLQRGAAERADANMVEIVGLAERMSEISAQLKMFARKSADQLAPVSVQAACQYALNLYRQRIQTEQVRVVTEWPEETLYVQADMVRLEQVMVNLISNALHAMEGVAEPVLTLRATRHQQQVDIRICDNGPGIPDAHLGKLFDPFFTTKESGKGLGLGLSISQRIIEELGGDLAAHNREGDANTLTGAELVITLPVVRYEGHEFSP